MIYDLNRLGDIAAIEFTDLSGTTVRTGDFVLQSGFGVERLYTTFLLGAEAIATDCVLGVETAATGQQFYQLDIPSLTIEQEQEAKERIFSLTSAEIIPIGDRRRLEAPRGQVARIAFTKVIPFILPENFQAHPTALLDIADNMSVMLTRQPRATR